MGWCSSSGARHVACALAFLCVASNEGRANTPAELRRQAFELAYNLDHDEAQSRLEQALAMAPNEAATHRAIASITWLNVLFQRGAITVDHYLGSVARPHIDVTPPPAEMARRFHRHVDRAVLIARERTQREPREPQAYYDLGAALGLRASWTASVEGKLRAGFQSARGAFDAHERVLHLDRNRHDAGVVVGTYRYLVATLSFPMRWVAYIAGFGGGKERGIQMLERAASYGGDSRTEARFALILIYNRERRYDAALRVIRELQAQFPRNRLLGLEYGGTALRAGKLADAEVALSAGIEQLAKDLRPKAGNEVAMWHYKRGAARVRLGRLDEAEADLRVALSSDAPRWIRGRATLETGRITERRGNRRGAHDQYRQAIALCEADRDPLCVSDARAALQGK